MRIKPGGSLGAFFAHLNWESKKVQELNHFSTLINDKQTVLIEVDKRDHQKIKNIEVIDGKWWQRSLQIAKRKLTLGKTYHYSKDDIYRDLAAYLDHLTEEAKELESAEGVDPGTYRQNVKILERLEQNMTDIAQRMFHTDLRGLDLIDKMQQLSETFGKKIKSTESTATSTIFPSVKIEEEEELTEAFGKKIKSTESTATSTIFPSVEIEEEEEWMTISSDSPKDVIAEDAGEDEEAIKPRRHHFLGRATQEELSHESEIDNRPETFAGFDEENENVPIGNELPETANIAAEDVAEKDQSEWTPVDDLRYLCEQLGINKEEEWFRGSKQEISDEIMEHVRSRESGKEAPYLAHNAMVALLETKSPQRDSYQKTFNNSCDKYLKDSSLVEFIKWRIIFRFLLDNILELRDSH